jgi:hypothetical protein
MTIQTQLPGTKCTTCLLLQHWIQTWDSSNTKYYTELYKYLTLINIKDNDTCTVCNSHVETLLYLFVNCEYVSCVWQALQDWLVSCGYVHVQYIEAKDILLENPDEDIIFNFVILIAKCVIYRSKLTEKRPTFARSQSLSEKHNEHWNKHSYNTWQYC